MADDDRYGAVKATLDDNYLLGKQEFPRDLLAAKRLLTDFKVGAALSWGVFQKVSRISNPRVSFDGE